MTTPRAGGWSGPRVPGPRWVSFRLVGSFLTRRAGSPRMLARLALVALAAAVWPWVWGRSMGPWLAEGPAPTALPLGILTGLYLGCIETSSLSFVDTRWPRWRGVALRWVTLVAFTAGLGAIALVGESWARSGSVAPSGHWAAWVRTSAVLSALACALQSWSLGPRRSFLTAVALAWWIPAVLPPSFLGAVPRALRGTFEGGAADASASEPQGWLADTALVAGLLLLAWAPRRATGRGHEVRHPG